MLILLLLLKKSAGICDYACSLPFRSPEGLSLVVGYCTYVRRLLHKYWKQWMLYRAGIVAVCELRVSGAIHVSGVSHLNIWYQLTFFLFRSAIQG